MATTTNHDDCASSVSIKEDFSASTAADEVDIFKYHLESYDNSKTVKALNLLYSLIVSLVSNVATRKFTKYHKIVGLVMGLISFILCRKFLKID
jgi:hypothetical protein